MVIGQVCWAIILLISIVAKNFNFSIIFVYVGVQKLWRVQLMVLVVSM